MKDGCQLSFVRGQLRGPARILNRAVMLFGALVVCSASGIAQEAKEADRWKAWQFLVGEWIGEGSGQPGGGSGGLSFNFDLQGKILVRKNRADYPATKERPAFSHEDLMVVYRESGATPTRAIYFDNEGHVIHYTAQFTADQRTLVFLSDLLPSAPRYRLTYTKAKNDTLSIKFEIAPPDKPESFSAYLQGIAHRK